MVVSTLRAADALCSLVRKKAIINYIVHRWEQCPTAGGNGGSRDFALLWAPWGQISNNDIKAESPINVL